MPAWEPLLTDQDCWDLVHYILSLREPRAATEPVHYAPVEIPTLPSDVSRGREYFKTFGCLACHGREGRGGVANPNAASGEEIPGLLYVAEGYTAEELAERIRKGLVCPRNPSITIDQQDSFKRRLQENRQLRAHQSEVGPGTLPGRCK